MPLLTSYLYRGVELNDGLNYSVPNQGSTLDDRQVADETWVYRRERTPISAGITLKEGTITLNIHIIANTSSEFQTKLEALYRIFDTTDPRYYQLKRRLPHEQYYRYIEVAPRQFSVSRTERKVSITLHTPERAWKEEAWQEVVFNLFPSGGQTHDLTVTNSGLSAVEPVVEIKPTSAGTGNTPQPMYFRVVEVYAASPLYNTPILLTDGWDTTGLVSAGKMRADGLDITVTLEDGTPVDRIIAGTQSNRKVWVLPERWPFHAINVQLPGPSSLAGLDENSTSVPVLITSLGGDLTWLPSSGTIAIGNEILSYSGIQVLSADKRSGRLTGLTRGLHGTTKVNLSQAGHWAVKFQGKFRIYYGYAGAYQNTSVFPNVIDNAWPMLDYGESTNAQWVQTNTAGPGQYQAGQGFIGGRPLTWWPNRWLTNRPGEYSYMKRKVSPDKTELVAYRIGYSGISERERVVCQISQMQNTRNVSRAKITYSIKGSSTSGGDTKITVSAGVTVSKFGDRFYIDPITGTTHTFEHFRELHTYQSSSSSFEQKDTGWMEINQDTEGSTHIWMYVKEAPWLDASNDTKLRIDRVDLLMDERRRAWPVTRMDATERGLAYGEYPLVMTWRNLTDPDGETFSIWPQVATNTTITYDCSEYTVTGEPLGTCSYQNTMWLRLLPGNNTIRVTGAAGNGNVQMKIRWRNKH